MRGGSNYQGPDSRSPSWVVPEVGEGTRLDTFVRRCLPHLSQRVVRRAVREGSFCVNGRPVKKGVMLFGGETLTYEGDPGLLARRPSAELVAGASIHYEDEAILVLDKPAEIATHGSSGRERNTLANFLMAERPSLAAVGKSPWEPGLVHRLDHGTSGLILAAKDQDAFEDLRYQFRKGSVRKRYWALVWERTGSAGEIAYPLSHDPADRRKMKVVKDTDRERIRRRNWRAVTRFSNLGYGSGFSFLQVEIETGVTHQIRAHLQAIGHPLVGDPLYAGNRPDPFGLGRPFLHAYYLGFRHPRTGESVVIEGALPTGLEQVLDRLQIQR